MFNFYEILFSIFWLFSFLVQIDTFKTIGHLDNNIIKIDSTILGVDLIDKVDCVIVTGKLVKGIASFYSFNLDGTKTATGEIYRNNKLTGASNNLKLNTWVRVTNLKNGKTVIVRINDRMHPAMKKKGRVIDLSRLAAKKLDFINAGLTKVVLEVIEPPKKY